MDIAHNPKLDEMWPRISGEIVKARRWRRVAQRAPQLAVVTAVCLTIGGLARYILPRPHETVVPWSLTQIAPASNVSAEYPLVAGGRLFAIRGGPGDGRVVCVRKNSGTVEWESVARFDECRMASDERRLYLLYRTGFSAWRCVALDVRDGTELWRRPAEQSSSSKPSLLTAVRDGVAWSCGNHIVLCAAADGKTTWERMTAVGDVLSAVQSKGERVFAASSRTVYALQASSGELLWHRSLRGRETVVNGPGLLDLEGDRLYVAGRASDGKGRILCLRLETGSELWNAPSSVPSRLQVADGRVFVRSTNLSVLDARNGLQLWTAPLGGCSPVSFGKGRLYVVDAAERRQIVAINSQSGQTAWRRSFVGSCSGPVLDRGMGFISGNDGILRTVALN